MANKILLEVVTPDKLLLSKEVEVVVATSIDGEFAVLYGHVPFLASLAVGEMRFKDGGNTEYAAIAGGFAEVTGTKVTVLAEAAELAREIDVNRAERAAERARERIEKAKTEGRDYVKAQAALHRAMLRIRMADKAKL
ncbi:F0F1 ATP synthase subunit epsilon [Dethiosulfatarculus sandiegensis]|uniref:ATP synthase epsilon chain n=1 Tax=Dethiosulfatarculus sandiegensis TaxID=1429043 RepID=A0A0D2J8Q5_9BACT|nr:F0F1 ATP synthase subunit epsilon [Dethiosulfatarculus sandiegensis]KIX14524.1 F0F1 ATP synthase subunit epsilon [Dethiosulfatarculus sandiegensis]